MVLADSRRVDADDRYCHCLSAGFLNDLGNGSVFPDQIEKVNSMRKSTPLALILALTGLAACDRIDTDLERAAVGAAAGCVAGEVLVNGRCVEGAIIGGAAGALSNDI